MFSHAFILGFLDFVVPNLFLSSFRHPNWYWISAHYEQLARFQEIENLENYDNLISHIEDLHKLQDCPMAKEDISGYIQAPF